MHACKDCMLVVAACIIIAMHAWVQGDCSICRSLDRKRLCCVRVTSSQGWFWDMYMTVAAMGCRLCSTITILHKVMLVLSLLAGQVGCWRVVLG
jgi:hypothetical protein